MTRNSLENVRYLFVDEALLPYCDIQWAPPRYELARREVVKGECLLENLVLF